ncbi:transcription antitermination factor NusB [Helicobacter mustelae]|uniref:Transcription antitermination protein NusB n=1 Tax=Helicobacter mustelae (strain ATCC 43772 / CCUG 25715 / CIP 103759 / LMG 18044 / NCTC 12198 / R85-136P) TaxID=679897 RepID=D3UG05_HELM1|nr:transcription antitermination factor NusB [Helicobacter mustelae]CBG39426.1 transcription termination protein [Helicobacter mustelae 12198]SQH70938.1 transcription termination protein [Helicobacter mustelae]STP12064.1 transcription termination protein [Helicobacter mustelae]
MATRSQAREAVIGFLYAYDIGNLEIRKMAVDILEEKKIRNKQQSFALDLFDGILKNLDLLDEQITRHLKDWEFKKLGGMERAILRLGAYEILCCQIDKPIVINEAIELAKSYGEEMAPKLINGVLDSLKK